MLRTGDGMHQQAPSQPCATALSVQGLSLRYGQAWVLKALNWEVPVGQVVGLLGRNGAGKTSLLEAVLGLREPAAGQLHVLGCPVQALSDDIKAQIGYVPQNPQLFEWMRPRQMLDYFKALYPTWNQVAVDALLERWGIDTHCAIGQLSQGQQQCLSIVRALAHEPSLLLLDEPVASLDPMARRDFLAELVLLVDQRGATVVFSSHILTDLARVATHAAFLAAGRMVVQAPIDELNENCRRMVGGTAEVDGLVHSQGWQVLSRRPLSSHTVQVLAMHPQAHGCAVDSGVKAQIQTLNLEELFLELAS